jgi:hypothetical protein
MCFPTHTHIAVRDNIVTINPFRSFRFTVLLQFVRHVTPTRILYHQCLRTIIIREYRFEFCRRSSDSGIIRDFRTKSIYVDESREIRHCRRRIINAFRDGPFAFHPHIRGIQNRRNSLSAFSTNLNGHTIMSKKERTHTHVPAQAHT